MEFLLANAVGPVKRVSVNGRQFLVARMTMLVPGVLKGSHGPLYYPPDEVNRTTERWNGMPITNGHPSDALGNPVTGRTPEVMEQFELGRVYRARFDGALKAEAWFDEALVRKNAPDLLPRLQSGQVTELSTGLFTHDEPVANGKCPKTGRAYTHVARNHRPDHLAVLLNQKGACSTDDGCGLGVNADNSQTVGRAECVKKLKEGEEYEDCTGVNDPAKYTNDKPVKNDQPHSSDTGRFKAPNAGTGKSETRDAALLGTVDLTPRHHLLGMAAQAEERRTGNNPPSWVTDPGKWAKAKTAATKAGCSDFYACVTAIYENMGGAIKHNAFRPHPHSAPTPTTNVIRKKGDKYCIYSESGKKLGEYSTRAGAEKRLRQIEYFKRKKDNAAPTPKKISTNEGIDMFKNRKDAEAHLTANCDCWKGKADALKALDDETVVNLANDSQELEQARDAVLVVNALHDEFGVPDEVALNEMPAFIKKKVAAKSAKEDPDDDDDDAADDGDDDDEYPKKNQQGRTAVTLNKETLLAELGKLSQDEILTLPGMAGLRERDQLSQQILATNKQQAIERLTANVSDAKKRKERQDKLGKLTLNELLDRLEDLPAQTGTAQQPRQFTVYHGAGAAGNPTANAGDDFKPKGMAFPTVNWAEEKKVLDAQQKGVCAG